MAQYRFYIVGLKDQLQPAQTLVCIGDSDAIAQAAGLLPEGRAAELWAGGRLVGRFSKLGVFTPAAA